MSTETPAIEPYESGLLDVGRGNHVYWEQCGSPTGVPVLRVHGGPGSGCTVAARGRFDADRYRTILFDQRNCGRSLPHASDPNVDLRANTTAHLIADMELLREHLGVDSWFLYGGSWGSTLILAYAQEHPERVAGIVIPAVTMSRRSEIAWLYEGVGRIFPAEHQRFREYIPADERGSDIFDLIGAYARYMRHPDRDVRARTALEWVTWEDAVISAEATGSPGAYSSRIDEARFAFVRICAHYFSQGCFLEEDQLLRKAWKLKGIPGALVHGRVDLGGPLVTAYELSKAWPDADLIVVEGAGHTGNDEMTSRVDDAFERVVQRGHARLLGGGTAI